MRLLLSPDEYVSGVLQCVESKISSMGQGLDFQSILQQPGDDGRSIFNQVFQAIPDESINDNVRVSLTRCWSDLRGVDANM